MTLLNTIARGAAWMTGAQWAIQILQFAVSIFIARLLSPADYGLVGMSAAFTAFVILFANLGFGAALIQKKDIDEDDTCTAFWATVLVGVFLYIISFAVAPLVGRFYGEPKVEVIIKVSAVIFLFSPISIILESLLTRQMAFREIALTNMGSSLVSQILTLTAAFAGLGVWSLVIGTLGFQIIRMPALFYLNRWFPKLRFSRNHFSSLFSFGGYLLGFNFLNFINRNADNVIIGRFLGATALGYYDLAYQVMLKPLQNVSGSITKPLFPVLSSIREDKPRVAETYRSVVVYISLITFPIMLGLAVVAPEFIFAVLGEKWAPAIPLLQILCIVGAMQSIGATCGDIFLSQGRSDILFKWTLFFTPIIVGAFFLGIKWGTIGVAFCYSIVTLLVCISFQIIANRMINLSTSRFLSALFPAAKWSIVMAAAVLFTQHLLKYSDLSYLTRFFVLVFLGIVSYGVAMYMSKLEELTKIRSYIRDRIFH
jgi:PST family polysaccharide transporter